MFLYVKLLMYLSELFIGDMCINLCCRNIFVSKKLLDRAEIGTISEQGSGEGVTKGMGRNRFNDTSLERSY